MKRNYKLIFAALAAFAIAACRPVTPDTPDTPDEPDVPDTPEVPDAPVAGIKGMLVLNNGNWGSNDASAAVYDPEAQTVEADVFFKANGQHLGDLGQDILVVGDEMYISMNGSKLVFVTDMELKLKKTIEVEFEGTKMAPRYLAEHDGKVYVTYYEGFLGEITPGSYNVRTTAIGSYPEGLCIRNGKAYIANSGYGYDNTISVVDLATFKEEKKIEVNANPQYVVANQDGTVLYVCSWDTYDPVSYEVLSPSKLQAVYLDSGRVLDLQEYHDVKCIVEGPKNLLLIAQGGYDENWQVCGTIGMLDMSFGDRGTFIDDPISNYYSLSYSNGYVFVGASDYRTNGDVYVYDSFGAYIGKFDSQGLNPQKVIYLE